MSRLPQENREILLTAREMLKLWDISPESLSNWVNEGMPKAEQGKYPLFACGAWIRGNKTTTESTLIEERRKKLEVERKLKELELLVKEGKLIPRSEVLNEFLSRQQAIKNSFLHLHRRLSPMLVGKEAREIDILLKKEHYSLLEEYSRQSGVLK